MTDELTKALEETSQVELMMASKPEINKVGWRIIANSAKEAIAIYEQIKNVGKEDMLDHPFVGNEYSAKPNLPKEQEQKFDVNNPHCPTCGGAMWDNRLGKQKPTSPDFVCKQDKGQCLNAKGYKTSVFLKNIK